VGDAVNVPALQDEIRRRMPHPTCPLCGHDLQRIWERAEDGTIARCPRNVGGCGANYRGPWLAEPGFELPKGRVT